ncbi:hypothetical protein RvY_07452-1 [Ramazzottius varieornatus]|uniref:Uncharacterized protein n=1 Tax=Ramazzottius varieornatus TaxID=947166 RepID=A0A1D1VAP8_RAMVA|nr:hypothetical protein RvY_07452-1 [Ramazzottius varieornatus]
MKESAHCSSDTLNSERPPNDHLCSPVATVKSSAQSKGPASVQVEDPPTATDNAATKACVLLPKSDARFSVLPAYPTAPHPSGWTTVSERVDTAPTVSTTRPAPAEVSTAAATTKTVQKLSSAASPGAENSAHLVSLIPTYLDRYFLAKLGR